MKDELLAGFVPLLAGFIALLVFALLVRGAANFGGWLNDLLRLLG